MSSSDKDFGIIVLNNFISQDQCLKITKYFDELKEPDVYGTEESSIRKIAVSPNIGYMKNILLNILNKTQELYTQKLFISEFMISSYRPGYSMGVHTDEEDGKEHFTASAVLYLNKDFTGGDVFFPERKIKHSPTIGDLVIFDSKDHKNLHGVETTTSGIRYVSPVWMTDNKEKALSFVHN